MRAIVFTEGGAQWGMGHLVRCSAYEEELVSQGWKVDWRVCGDSMAQAFLIGRAARMDVWHGMDPALEKELEKALEKELEDLDLAIIDSYYAPWRTYATISKHAKNCVYLDDEARLAYPKGFVVNSVQHAEQLPYKLGEGTTLLAGPKFHPLRAEFRRGFQRKIQTEIRDILILMGGSDIRGLTPSLLQCARGIFPRATIRAVVANPSQRENWVHLESANTFLLGQLGAAELRQRMEAADLCLSASGQSVFELCRLGLPTIGISVADNQRHIQRGFREAGAILDAGRWDDPAFDCQLRACLEGAKALDTRLSLSQAGQSLVDGNGCRHVLSTIYQGDWACSKS